MKLGFIGSGNMAKAIISGVLSSSLIEKDSIFVSDISDDILEDLKSTKGVNTSKSNINVAKMADIIILAIKPIYYKAIIEEISSFVDGKIIVTIAPGWSLAKTCDTFKKEMKIVRTMPNTPAMVLEGMTAICKNEMVTDEEMEKIIKIFNSFGKCEIVSEHIMEAVISVSGSSPAYVYMFIEALADGAVLEGMPRDKAYKFAAQTVLGSAKMVLESGLHPAVLKDMVCSPGGTTIEAVKSLEKSGFRGAVLDAMSACAEKARKM